MHRARQIGRKIMDFKFIKHTIYNGKRYLKDDTEQLSKNEGLSESRKKSSV